MKKPLKELRDINFSQSLDEKGINIRSRPTQPVKAQSLDETNINVMQKCTSQMKKQHTIDYGDMGVHKPPSITMSNDRLRRSSAPSSFVNTKRKLSAKLSSESGVPALRKLSARLSSESGGYSSFKNPKTIQEQDDLYVVKDGALTRLGEHNSGCLERRKSYTNVEIPLPEDNRCIFCLDGGDLIHMCTCNVMSHKKCALQYIKFPGKMNDCCCQCLALLEYNVLDDETPMAKRYKFAFTFLVIAYIAMVGASYYCTYLLIPSDKMNIYLYVVLVANLSILWPLLLVYMIGVGMEFCYGPADRSRTRSVFGSSTSGFFGGEDCNCGDGGDCGIFSLVLCLLVVLFILIAASAYLIMSLIKYYNCFVLKSKKEIVFKHEGRPLNNIAYNTRDFI